MESFWKYALEPRGPVPYPHAKFQPLPWIMTKHIARHTPPHTPTHIISSINKNIYWLNDELSDVETN